MKRKVYTFEQRRQRELAWLLYITEGYIANVANALQVNGATLDRRALATMKNAMRNAENTAREIRAELGG